MYRSAEDIGLYPAVGAVPSVRNMTHPTASDPFATPSQGSLNTPPVSGTIVPPDGRPRPDTVVPPDTGSPPNTATVQGRPRGRRALVVAGACAAALAVWLLAGPVLGTDLTVRPAPGAATQEVTAASVVLSCVLAGLAGWALLVLLERLTTHGAMVWRWLAGVVALLSLGGPLTLGQGTGAVIVLTLLHVVVAGVLLVALPGSGPAAAGRSRAGRTTVSTARPVR